MTAVLKVRGVPYRSMDEVESAILKLAADALLSPEADDENEDLSRHVGELLTALPDERAEAMLLRIASDAFIAPAIGNAPPQPTGADGAEGRRDEAQADAPPVCPMCLGHGTLELEPPQDPTAQRCPACEGYGKVYTGSRVQGRTQRDCPTCNGDGFIAKTPDIPLPPPPVRAAPAPAWPGATWDTMTHRWAPPEGDAPWEDATWDGMEGKYI